METEKAPVHSASHDKSTIVSLYDMCYAKNTSFTKELWDEKITDSLNYLFLLAAIIKEAGNYERN